MSLQVAPSLYHVKTSLFTAIQAENEVSTRGKKRSGGRAMGSAQEPLPERSMTQEDLQTETEEVLLAPFDLLEGISESARVKTAETLLELLGARVRNPNTRSAYRVAWRSFVAFCSARQLELEHVKAYHVGAWLDQHLGSRSTQRQHLAAVRLLFDSLMMRGVVEYNPAARARPPRLVREPSQTTQRLKKRSIFGLNARTLRQIQVLHCFLPLAKIVKRLNRDAWIVGVC